MGLVLVFYSLWFDSMLRFLQLHAQVRAQVTYAFSNPGSLVHLTCRADAYLKHLCKTLTNPRTRNFLSGSCCVQELASAAAADDKADPFSGGTELLLWNLDPNSALSEWLAQKMQDHPYLLAAIDDLFELALQVI